MATSTTTVLGIASGATLNLNHSGTRTLDAGFLATGSGSISNQSGNMNIKWMGNTTAGFAQAGGGTINFDSAISIGALDVSSTVNINAAVSSGGFNFTTGTLTGAGNLTLSGASTWSGGTMSGTGTTTIASGATLDISGAAFKTINTLSLDNYGTINWSGTGAIQLMNSQAVYGDNAIRNQAGGLFDAQSDSNFSYGGGQTNFNNIAGTFRKSGGTGTTTLTPYFINTGLVDVQSGTVNFNEGGYNGGVINIASGHTLNWAKSSNPWQFDNGTVVQGGGTLNLTSGSVRLPGPLAGSGCRMQAPRSISPEPAWRPAATSPSTLAQHSA